MKIYEDIYIYNIHVLYSHNPYARINEFRFEGLE